MRVPILTKSKYVWIWDDKIFSTIAKWYEDDMEFVEMAERLKTNPDNIVLLILECVDRGLIKSRPKGIGKAKSK